MLAAMKRKCPELSSGEDELSHKARAFSVYNLLNFDSSQQPSGSISATDDLEKTRTTNSEIPAHSVEDPVSTTKSSEENEDQPCRSKDSAECQPGCSQDPSTTSRDMDMVSSCDEVNDGNRTPSPDSSSGGGGGDGTATTPVLRQQDVVLQLFNNSLWDRFHQLGTEMIITKAGRRMFPSIKVKISGLDPDSFYRVLVEMVSMDDNKYRYVYHSSQWVVAGQGEPRLSSDYNIYVHPDSPASGRFWLNHDGLVTFDKLKLTNNKHPSLPGQISLHSMHKYQPVVHVVQVSENVRGDGSSRMMATTATSNKLSFVFPQVAFITVTAYQNQQITLLKITSNPFAKGFRENSKTRSSRCRQKETKVMNDNEVTSSQSECAHLINPTLTPPFMCNPFVSPITYPYDMYPYRTYAANMFGHIPYYGCRLPSTSSAMTNLWLPATTTTHSSVQPVVASSLQSTSSVSQKLDGNGVQPLSDVLCNAIVPISSNQMHQVPSAPSIESVPYYLNQPYFLPTMPFRMD